MKKTNKLIAVDSIWTAEESKFKVNKVSIIKDKTWIFYKSISKNNFGQEYSCYEEAFRERFSEIVN